MGRAPPQNQLWKYPSDDEAPNNTWYINTSDGYIKYKDEDGNIRGAELKVLNTEQVSIIDFLNLETKSFEPSSPSEGDIYRSDGSWGAGEGLNRYDGSSWNLVGGDVDESKYTSAQVGGKNIWVKPYDSIPEPIDKNDILIVR